MEVIEVTNENFENEVLKSDKPVLADFNAEWCGPCQMMRPILDEFAAESDAYKIVSIDIDNEDALASEYEISSIPCLVVFKDGKEITRNVGLQSKKKLAKMLGV